MRSATSGRQAKKGASRRPELGWACAAAGALLLSSTFAVIHSTHACRTLYAELQLLESAQWHLQEDYGRLLLEQSTWASHHRVEKVARSELGMASPDLTRYKVVAQ